MKKFNSYKIELYSVSDVTFNEEKLQQYLDLPKVDTFTGQSAALNGFKKYVENTGKWTIVSAPFDISDVEINPDGSVSTLVTPKKNSTTKPFNVAVLYRIGNPDKINNGLSNCNVELVYIYHEDILIPRYFDSVKLLITKQHVPFRVSSQLKK